MRSEHVSWQFVMGNGVFTINADFQYYTDRKFDAGACANRKPPTAYFVRISRTQQPSSRAVTKTSPCLARQPPKPATSPIVKHRNRTAHQVPGPPPSAGLPAQTQRTSLAKRNTLAHFAKLPGPLLANPSASRAGYSPAFPTSGCVAYVPARRRRES